MSGNSLLGATGPQVGGGIYNLGTLTVKGTTVNSNRQGIVFGGGIYNAGTLRLQNSQLNNNYAEDGGGIFIEGPTTITSTQLVGNGGDDGAGAIANFFSGGTVTVSGSKISGNTGDFRGAIDQRGHMVLRQTQILTVPMAATVGG